MNVQLASNIGSVRPLHRNTARIERGFAGVEGPQDSVTLSSEALSSKTRFGSKSLRKMGMYLTLSLALVMGLGAAGSVHAAEPAGAKVTASQTVTPNASTNVVVVPASGAREAGRRLHEVGMKGKEAGKEIGRVGKEVGQEVGRAGKKFGLKVGSVAKDFWSGVRGK